MRRTIVAVVASFSLVLSGTGAVIASKGSDKSKGKDPKSDDGKDKNAAKKQYTKCKTQKSNGSNKTNGKSGDSGNSQQNCVPKSDKSQKSQKSQD